MYMVLYTYIWMWIWMCYEDICSHCFLGSAQPGSFFTNIYASSSCAGLCLVTGFSHSLLFLKLIIKVILNKKKSVSFAKRRVDFFSLLNLAQFCYPAKFHSFCWIETLVQTKPRLFFELLETKHLKGNACHSGFKATEYTAHGPLKPLHPPL